MTRTVRAILAGSILAGLFALTLFSCLLGVSQEDRVDQFLRDLNQTDRSDMYLNFYAGATLYGTLDDTHFDTFFPEDSIPYSLTGLDFSGNPVTGLVSGTGGTFPGTPQNIEFTMVQDGPDWVISVLTLSGSDIVY